jgi:SAM-dependent methyltransferase
MTDQDELFVRGEGDSWFHRNSAYLNAPVRVTDDRVMKVVELARLQPRRAVEIGASNGYRLDALAKRYGCSGLALEPSALAVVQGRRTFPGVRFVRAVASELPIATGVTFDLVIVYFVLHWVGRSRLLQAVAEIDRLVQAGGHLVIGDFHPPAPERVPYHHRPGENIWTYKQDYAALFHATAFYDTEMFAAFDVGAPTSATGALAGASTRGAVTLLRKRTRSSGEEGT